MIFRVCECHGRKPIVKWTHTLCEVTGQKLELVEERDSTRPGRSVTVRA